MVREGLSEEVTHDMRPEGVSESAPKKPEESASRGSGKCRVPWAAKDMSCLRKVLKASVNGAE